MASRNSLTFPAELRVRVDPYLPQKATARPANKTASALSLRPFVTLTYAVSLDSQIAAAPGTQTILSGPESKAMTHYLRTRHDAIAVGAGTAVADDPTLNSRLEEVHGMTEAQPRPVVFDRSARWHVSRQSKVLQAAATGNGKAPWIFVKLDSMNNVSAAQTAEVEAVGGSYIPCPEYNLPSMLDNLAARGIKSIMIEGGGVIINDILTNYLHLVDSIIITVAPVYLGQGGVQVCPPKLGISPAVAKFDDVTWTALGADTVMCGRPHIL